MPKVERFEDLACWKKARALNLVIFQLANKAPLSRDYDVRSQLRRASLSVMNNIAEGFCRFSRPEFIRFLDFAQSSAGEVVSMLYVLQDIAYLKKAEAEKLIMDFKEVQKMILGLIKYLRSCTKK